MGRNYTLKVILFVLIFCSITLCQNNDKTDSLFKKLATASGTQKVELFSDISDSYLSEAPAKSIEFAKKSLQLAMSLNYKKGIGDSYNLLGRANYNLGKYSDALAYYKSAIAIREEAGSKKEIASSYSNLGLLYNDLGNYEKSLEYGLKALRIREEVGDKYSIGASLLNVGLIYFNIADYKSALNNYLEAYNIMDSLKKENAALLILNHIGSVYRRLNKPDQALEYYNRSLRLSQNISDKKGQADSYYSIANINWDLNNFAVALEYYKKSLVLYNQTGDKYSLANAYNSTAITFRRLNRFTEMKYYLDKGLALASVINSEPLIGDNYQYTSEYYEGLHDYSNALKYFKLFAAINDTLFNKQTNEQIEDLKTRYETEKKEQEITRLQQEKQLQDKELEVQRIWRSSLTGGIIFLGALIFIIYNRYNLKKKSEEKIKRQNIVLENLNNEKDMFLGIAAHDLKNPLASIIIDTATIKMMHSKNKFEDISRKADEIELTAGRMKDIVSKLLDLNKIESGNVNPETSNFDLVALIKELNEVYKKPSEIKDINILFSSSEESILLKSDRNLVTQIMDNLVSNAIKFSEKEKNVFINIEKLNNKAVIRIKDEGPGFSGDELNTLFNKFSKFSARPTAGEHSTGLGLSIVKTLTEMLQGKVRCESALGSGSTFYVELPLS